MDIVRITLRGYGFDVARGIVTKKEYNKIKDSHYFEDVWVKDLFKKVENQFKFIKQEFHDFGLVRGDLIITVNEQEFINLPISVVDSFNDTVIEGYQYPITDDVVVTCMQELDGTFMDVIFITADDFDFDKLTFVKKVIQNEKEEVIISNLLSEVYYDGELIKFTGNDTDLRMSSIYFDTDNIKTNKNEKNYNRRF